eukprot:2682925-Amphidinium_carterae.1
MMELRLVQILASTVSVLRVSIIWDHADCISACKLSAIYTSDPCQEVCPQWRCGNGLRLLFWQIIAVPLSHPSMRNPTKGLGCGVGLHVSLNLRCTARVLVMSRLQGNKSLHKYQ